MAEEGFRAEEAAVPPDARNVRILKRVVYILGILIVVGTLALIGGIVWKAGQLASVRAPQGFGEASLPVPKGAVVRHMAFDGDRLAVTVEAEGMSEILLIDPRQGSLAGRIRLVPAQ
ncbi:MAG: DUF6476 family protein [Parvibaculaceae bacterium]